MLSLHGFQPSLSSLMGTEWPVRSLWPEITSLYRQADVLLELKSSLEQLEKLQHMQEIYPIVRRKLHVSGKTEKKQEDGKGSYSYRTQEFRRVFALPQGVFIKYVSCAMFDVIFLLISLPRCVLLSHSVNSKWLFCTLEGHFR
uniref:SHSP domain-containing protein n=1 Tax=Sinocyclocheilus anshuiensis TaxID=1608454 RepID=A0A671T8L8_9TELE